MRQFFEAGIRRVHHLPELAPCTVEHIGRRTLVLTDGVRLVPVTRDEDGLLPGGISLATEVFDVVRAALAGLGRDDRLPSWFAGADLPAASDLSLRQQACRPERLAVLAGMLAAEERGTGVIDAAPLRRRAAGLVPALAHPRWARREVRELIGAGPGATPTGDDILVGALAGLELTGRRRELITIGGLVPPLLTRTTRTSQHFLHWALAGQYASTVHAVAAGLSGSVALEPAVAGIRHWGASSGVDLLHGLVGVLTAGENARGGAA